jgi:hypothetical protein
LITEITIRNSASIFRDKRFSCEGIIKYALA